MKELGLNEIREKFLTFFEGKQHQRLASFPLVPINDKSLLLINSGMAPLKPYFTGQEAPPSKRVTTCQKCIRTNDIDNVGVTSRHGSFFEMLGNFSFGDYFKAEVIPWAWEFVTRVMEIPEQKLYVSVYLDDDEAYNIWRDSVGVPPERIVRLGKEDNFWEVGLGPCGPCSEIHYDRGPEYGCGSPDCAVGCDCDRFIEVWNLVFTQFNKEEDGSYSRLSHPNIDTGMGLERMACVLQGVNTLFDVDTIRAIRDKICNITGVTYGADAKKDVSIRIITDHIRSVTFMTADGVLPSNEGRGYVLRRLLRRAARHGKLLGVNGAFLTELSGVVIDISKAAYPELEEKHDYIFKIISLEENRFIETIDAGMEIFRRVKDGVKGILSGTEAFKLYDTFGFPLELMREILDESGMKIDIDGFNQEMNAQKERARAARGESNYMGAEETVFNRIDAGITSEYMGTDVTAHDGAAVLAIAVGDELRQHAVCGEEVAVILDRTPFYAESGGQCGDRGTIRAAGGVIEIKDCKKVVGNRIAHIGAVTSGEVRSGDNVRAEIDIASRMATARNHTSTHLLHKALRQILGTHVEQSGSSVDPERLRFDFTHFSPMTRDELDKTEAMVNDFIFNSMDVNISERPIDEARKMGAMALFGEKYGQTVRVVDIGGVSVELCGGAHLKNTSQAGIFKIISESGIASGVRRIEALTGRGALEYFKRIEERQRKIGDIVKALPDNLIARVGQMIDRQKELDAELQKLRAHSTAGLVDDIVNKKEMIGDVAVIAAYVGDMGMDGMKELGDKIKDKISNAVAVLASAENDEKVNFLVMATDDAVKAGVNAGGVIKEVSAIIGGRGGGRNNIAQAGGKEVGKISEALQKAKDVIAAALN